MGGILSKKTRDLNRELPLTAAVAVDVTDKTDLTDISFKAGFQSLSLDTVIEITGSRLETSSYPEVVKMTIECKKHIWKDKNLSLALQDYFAITSNPLPWRKENEEQNDDEIMKNALEDFIQKFHSLEQQLRKHYTKIGPKKRRCRILQFVASIFAMMPVIGPLNLQIFGASTQPFLPAQLSAPLSIGFLVMGGIGSSGVWFCKRKRNALGVQEEVISPVLLSTTSRKKDLIRISHRLNEVLSMQNHDDSHVSISHRLNEGLSMQNHDDSHVTICDFEGRLRYMNLILHNFEGRLRKDMNLILQKLSGQESASPWGGLLDTSIRAVRLNSERNMY